MTKVELEIECKELKQELKEAKKDLRIANTELQDFKTKENNETNVLTELKRTNKEIISNEHKLRKEHRANLDENKNLKIRSDYLEKQLNGLTDLFNETFTSFKENVALIEMFYKQSKYTVEHLENMIARFNRPPVIQKGDETE